MAIARIARASDSTRPSLVALYTSRMYMYQVFCELWLEESGNSVLALPALVRQTRHGREKMFFSQRAFKAGKRRVIRIAGKADE